MHDVQTIRPDARWRARVTLLVLAALVAFAVASKVGEIRGDLQSDLLALEPLDAPAPDFALLDRDGKQVRLADLRGKWVFLNFWATWCEACKAEMPSMALLGGSLAGKDFVMVAASVDEGWEPVDRFLGARFPELKVLLDPEARWAHAFGTEKFPESYLIAPDGRLRARFVGPRDWEAAAFRDFFEQQLGRTAHSSR